MKHPLIAHHALDFLLHNWLRKKTLFALPALADHDRVMVDATLDLSKQVQSISSCRKGGRQRRAFS